MLHSNAYKLLPFSSFSSNLTSDTVLYYATILGSNWRSWSLLLSGNREISHCLKCHFPRLSKSPTRQPHFIWSCRRYWDTARPSLACKLTRYKHQQAGLSCRMCNKNKAKAWRFVPVISLEKLCS